MPSSETPSTTLRRRPDPLIPIVFMLTGFIAVFVLTLVLVDLVWLRIVILLVAALGMGMGLGALTVRARAVGEADAGVFDPAEDAAEERP